MSYKVNFFDCLIEQIVSLLTHYIELGIETSNYSFSSSREFSSSSKISLQDLLSRLIHACEVDYETLIITMIYISRASTKIRLSSQNIHKILISSFISAIKFWHDNIFDDATLSKIAGLRTKEFVIVESAFLNLINYNLYIKKDEYDLVSSMLTPNS